MNFSKIIIVGIFLLSLTEVYAQPIFSFKDEKGKFGFKDASGKILVQPKYDYASKYENGLVYVNIGKKYGYVNRNGVEVIPVIYDQVGYREKNIGLVWVYINSKYGYVDTTNKEVIPIKYSWLDSEFKNGVAKASIDQKYGLINRAGEEIVPIIYDRIDLIWYYSDLKSIIVEKDSKYGMIDINNKILLEIKYDWINYESEVNWAIVSMNNKKTAYDYSGNKILDFEFDMIKSDLLTRRACIRVNNKWMLMDKEGNKLTEAIYDEMGDRNTGTFSANGNTGFFAVGMKSGSKYKYGFIDMNGKEVTEIKYDYCDDLKNSYAIVVLNGKYGLVDNTGKEIIKPETYDHLNSYSDGLVAVNLGGKWNKEIEPDFEGGKWGFIDLAGKVVIPIQYDYVVWDFYEGKAKVRMGKKEFFIDKEGNEIK